MYIRRACIDEIGLFDAKTWGRGYGEEVDFCMKAAAAGWRNVLAPDVFIVHRGNVSFGDEKLERILVSAKKIAEKFPFYDGMIQRFLKADPVMPARRAVNLGLIAKALPARRMLHVTHGFGGGTEQYVQDVARMARDHGVNPIVLRFAHQGGARLSFDLGADNYGGFLETTHHEAFGADELGLLKDTLKELDIASIHIHSPFWLPADMLEWLMSTFPSHVTIHDYAWMCPRVTLCRPGGRYCGEPDVTQCASCVSVHEAEPGLLPYVERVEGDIGAYRAFFAEMLAKAGQVFVAAEDVKARLLKHGFEARYKTIPHPAPAGSIFALDQPMPEGGQRSTLTRVAFLGGISEWKGFYQLLACAELAQKRRLPIQFIVFGYTLDDTVLKDLNNVVLTGKYEEEELYGLMDMYRPNLAFFPNQWPETFSYTLSHCFRLGLWPVVTDIGAPAERVRASGYGTILPKDADTATILDALLNEAVALHDKTHQGPTATAYPATYAEYYGEEKQRPGPMDAQGIMMAPAIGASRYACLIGCDARHERAWRGKLALFWSMQ
jgi:glycosyltransferase involved in cell wall biosynthesis